MVESIGKTPGNTGAVTNVTGPAALPAAENAVRAPKTPAQPGAAVQLSGIAQTLSSSAPVDLDRVARIKKAIQEGNFPILPSTIADQMIALRMDWVARDEA